MATQYKATVEFECWKEHVCSACGAIFRYTFKRQGTEFGDTEEEAEQTARQTLERKAEKDVNFHPCPHCGLYQPEMVGSQKASQLAWVLICAGVATGVGLIILMEIATSGNLQMAPAVWVAASIGLLAVLANFWIAASKPNRNPAVNRAKASRAIDHGQLILVTPGAPPGFDLVENQGGNAKATWFYLALMITGLVAIASGELVRLACGWPVNPHCFPQVCGPGDTPTIYLPAEITSVKGYWQGGGYAEIGNSEGFGLQKEKLDVFGRNDRWEDVISGKDISNLDRHIYGEVKLPNSESLAWKGISIHMSLEVRYPHRIDNEFVVKAAKFEDTIRLDLGPAKSGSYYETLVFPGGLLGIMLIFLGNFLLWYKAFMMKWHALPGKLIPMEAKELPET